MSTLLMMLLYHLLHKIVNCLKIFFMDFLYFIDDSGDIGDFSYNILILKSLALKPVYEEI